METLSQDEIDELLAAICATPDDDEHSSGVTDIRKIKIYDFKRPDRFSKCLIRKMELLYETVTRSLSNSFSNKAFQLISCHVTSVDQLTNEEFIRCLPTPTGLWTFSDPSFRAEWILEIDPVIFTGLLLGTVGFSITDLKEKSLAKVHHQCLTDNQLAILQPFINDVISAINSAWNDTFPDDQLNLAYTGKSLLPQFAAPALGAYSDICCLVTIECAVGNSTAMMNIAMPYESNRKRFSRISNELSLEYNPYRPGDAKESVDAGQIPVTLEAIYRKDSLSMETLGGYLEQAANGQSVFIPLGKSEDKDNVIIKAGGEDIYYAHQTDTNHVTIKSPVKEA